VLEPGQDAASGRGITFPGGKNWNPMLAGYGLVSMCPAKPWKEDYWTKKSDTTKASGTTWVWFPDQRMLRPCWYLACDESALPARVRVGTQRTTALWAGVLATAGNLVFNRNGWMVTSKAFDANTRQGSLEFQTGTQESSHA